MEQNAVVKKSRSMVRPSEKFKSIINIGSQFPIEALTRRRCARCAQNKMEKRTKTV